jgi:hypothetical protein
VIPLVLATTIAASPSGESFSGNKKNGSDKVQDSECHSPNHRMHVGVRHTEANGVGYTDGYTTLEGFGIYDKNACFMPFLDLRGHVFNNGKLAGNIGIGSRSVIPQINHMIGVYFYYDVRQESRGMSVVNQVSPGLELIGKRMEYRMNGYVPVGNRHSRKYGYEFNKFDGNNIFLRYKQKFALKGGDAEVGVHLTQSTKYDLYTGVGPYYFSAGGAHGWGVKTRLLGRYKEYISLEGSYSYDRVFRNIVQGTVGFNYPFGPKLRRKGRNCPQQNDLMLSRAAFAPYRFEIPVVKKIRKNEKAINPATGKPWQVWFVNNTSSSAGTYQSPFPTLTDAENASFANDMIYVFPGDGSTTGMDEGIFLKDGQSFFGSGIQQKFATTKGTMIIPAMSSSFPTITSQLGVTFTPVVTIANDNVVSGFNVNIVNLLSAGIGSESPVIGATIANNIITSVIDQIPILIFGIGLDGTGAINIYNNRFNGNPSFGRDIGISVQSTGGNVTGSIKNNFIIAGDTGITIGSPSSINGSFDLTIQGNTVEGINAAVGGLVSIQVQMNEESNVKVVGNTILSESNNVFGIQMYDSSTTTSVSALVSNNQIISSLPTGQTFEAILFAFTNPSSSNLNATVTNNTVSGAAGAGTGSFNFNSPSTDTMCLTLENNTATGGYSFSTTGTGVINIDTFQGNGGGPISSSGNVFQSACAP